MGEPPRPDRASDGNERGQRGRTEKHDHLSSLFRVWKADASFEGEASRYEADFPVPPDRLVPSALEKPKAQGISELIDDFGRLSLRLQ